MAAGRRLLTRLLRLRATSRLVASTPRRSATRCSRATSTSRRCLMSISSCAPAASSASPTSCCGSRRTPNWCSRTRCGRTTTAATCGQRSRSTPPATADTAARNRSESSSVRLALMRRLHHVNVVVPPDATARVRDFYVDVLGLHEVTKPTEGVAQTGAQSPGAWFDIDDRTQVHVSERDGDRHPQVHSASAHWGLVVDDFDAVLARLAAANAPWEAQPQIFGGRRGFTRDPEGNRVEILEQAGELA